MSSEPGDRILPPPPRETARKLPAPPRPVDVPPVRSPNRVPPPAVPVLPVNQPTIPTLTPTARIPAPPREHPDPREPRPAEQTTGNDDRSRQLEEELLRLLANRNPAPGLTGQQRRALGDRFEFDWWLIGRRVVTFLAVTAITVVLALIVFNPGQDNSSPPFTTVTVTEPGPGTSPQPQIPGMWTSGEGRRILLRLEKTALFAAAGGLTPKLCEQTGSDAAFVAASLTNTTMEWEQTLSSAAVEFAAAARTCDPARFATAESLLREANRLTDGKLLG